MNVNRKLDRLKQWAEERMGGEARTNVSDDFRALEMEMNLRFEGKVCFGRIGSSMNKITDFFTKGWSDFRRPFKRMLRLYRRRAKERTKKRCFQLVISARVW